MEVEAVWMLRWAVCWDIMKRSEYMLGIGEPATFNKQIKQQKQARRWFAQHGLL